MAGFTVESLAAASTRNILTPIKERTAFASSSDTGLLRNTFAVCSRRITWYEAISASAPATAFATVTLLSRRYNSIAAFRNKFAGVIHALIIGMTDAAVDSTTTIKDFSTF